MPSLLAAPKNHAHSTERDNKLFRSTGVVNIQSNSTPLTSPQKSEVLGPAGMGNNVDWDSVISRKPGATGWSSGYMDVLMLSLRIRDELMKFEPLAKTGR